MSFPKQIIYNINYQKILIDLTFSKQSVNFIDNFKSLINAGPNKNLVMLGIVRYEKDSLLSIMRKNEQTDFYLFKKTSSSILKVLIFGINFIKLDKLRFVK